MDTNLNIEYWDLIAKYYSDECSQQEIDKLLKWKEENIENQILFNQIKEDLKIINLNRSMNKINVDSAWEKLKEKIQEEEHKLPIIEVDKNKLITFQSFLKYAATIVILVSIGFFATKVYKNISNNNMMEFVSLNEQGNQILLPDGSTVKLNANSKIIYPKTFAANERRIELEGEAFFYVTKNAVKPFIIEAKDAEVKVLGTSFNVNASIPGSKIEVFVQTGLVQLASKKDKEQKVLINPGNVGVLSKKNIVKEKNTDKNIIAWNTKEIVFEADTMKYIIETLNKAYNTNITCENEDILNLRYSSTSTFIDQEIDSILNVICITLNLKIDSTEGKIFLIKQEG